MLPEAVATEGPEQGVRNAVGVAHPDALYTLTPLVRQLWLRALRRPE
jgi:hypothetical protein